MQQFIPAPCKRFTCHRCGPVKKKLYQKAIFAARAEHKLQRHMILTLDPGLIPPEIDSLVYIQRVWARFRTYLRQHINQNLRFIRTIEIQGNGTAHFHVLIHQTLAQQTIIDAWTACGGGHQCRIRFRDGNRAAAYITKYITKEAVTDLPRYTRRVACSQDIHLKLLPPPSGWGFMKLSFLGVVCYALRWNYFQAHQSSIDAYFEIERPPEVIRKWTKQELWQELHWKRPRPQMTLGAA